MRRRRGVYRGEIHATVTILKYFACIPWIKQQKNNFPEILCRGACRFLFCRARQPELGCSFNPVGRTRQERERRCCCSQKQSSAEEKSRRGREKR
ncbi:hypothetical protein GUJ93_ZPchr0006g44111 [Zizania palustris]|uniref:Uncharacterized protein n=1 Tax=Zizania palustris TaxID=103762 RepID=A0A8J5W250_ZIZPA|nr:hypothetical protein GUJ93_ZPchr0006g44111 [Zizania palustris]